MFNRTKEKCVKCEKVVYPDDRVVVDQKVWHETCFRCAKCKTKLNLGTYAELGGTYYCKPHMQEAFRLAGSYSFSDKEKEKEFHASTPKIEDIISSVREGDNNNGRTEITSPMASSNEDTLYHRGAISQQMTSTDDMMSVEDQLARIKRQLDKNIISKEQYEQKKAELERRQGSSPRSAPVLASVEITRPRTNSRPSNMSSSPVSISPSMKRLMGLHGSDEPEYLNTTSSADVTPDVSSLKIEDSVYNEKAQQEKIKLGGLLSRGLITQTEFDALLTPQSLIQRNVVTQEEYDYSNQNQSQVPSSQAEQTVEQVQTTVQQDHKAKSLLDKGIITLDEYNQIVNASTPNNGVEQPQAEDEKKTDLNNKIEFETELIENIAFEIEKKKSELEALVKKHEEHSQKLNQLQAELKSL